MLKILYISESPLLKTGYGRVSKELLRGMCQSDHEVRVIGCGSAGRSQGLPYTIYPTDPQKDYWGYGALINLLNVFEPDIVMTLSDPWAMEPLFRIIDNFPSVYWIGYFPIDGKPIPRKWHQLINRMNKRVVISKFAQNEVKKILPFRDVELLYHGVDPVIYRPYPEEVIKKERELRGWVDKFIILNINRNQTRKQIPLTIKGFSSFAQGKPDVLLILRMQAVEEVGWDIPDLIDRYELRGKAVIVDAPALTGLPEEELIKLYNLADLHVSTTAGEGFGLTTLESLSCGTPVLITDCSNSLELVQSKEQLIKVKELIISNRNIEQAYADSDDLAEKLEYFYNNPHILEALGQSGRTFALNMTWDQAREKLMTILKDAEKELPGLKNKKVNYDII